MAGEDVFIPTHMPDYRGEVVGDVLMDFSCKSLLYGQCLMTVGRYVVRGLVFSCGKRAKAIRRQDGAFERVNPGSCFVALEPAAPPTLPQPQLPTDDLAAAASSICLKIQENTPRPASSTEATCLMPELEQQTAIEASELPLQEKIQLHENRTSLGERNSENGGC